MPCRLFLSPAVLFDEISQMLDEEWATPQVVGELIFAMDACFKLPTWENKSVMRIIDEGTTSFVGRECQRITRS